MLPVYGPLTRTGKFVFEPRLMAPPDIAELPDSVESTTSMTPLLNWSNRMPPPHDVAPPALPEIVLRAIVTRSPVSTPRTTMPAPRSPWLPETVVSETRVKEYFAPLLVRPIPPP